MKNYEIHCVIFDKKNPSDNDDIVEELELFTKIVANDEEDILDIIHKNFNIKQILDIRELL